MNDEEIIDGLKVICLCKGIRKIVFLKHIRSGIKGLEELRSVTGAGSGSCKGKRCTPKILEMLKQSG